MKSNRKAGVVGRRERRAFSAEFKSEAVGCGATRRERDADASRPRAGCATGPVAGVGATAEPRAQCRAGGARRIDGAGESSAAAREDGLAARPRRRHRVSTTDSNHDNPIAPNLLARQFDVNGVDINRVWIADITHIPTREGPLYLTTVLDLGSRRCVGWAMRETLEVELALSALRMARDARRPAPGLLDHSDRGSQYTSGAYRTKLAAHGMIASMSAKGDCYDNAVAESFFSTLEFELLMRNDWHTRDEARRAIFRYIETWYNRKRRHSTLGYLSPAAYERQLLEAA